MIAATSTPSHPGATTRWSHLPSPRGRRGRRQAQPDLPVAEGGDGWATVGGPRSRAESLNSKVKHRWLNKRIPAVGVEFQLIHLLGFGIALNTEAQLSYEKRTRSGEPPGPPPLYEDLLAA